MNALRTTAYVLLSLAALAYLLGGGLTIIRDALVITGLSSTDVHASSFANTEAAIVTVTNTGRRRVRFCARGIVTNGSSKLQAKTIPICASVEPMSTVEVKAPFRVGQILDLCNKENAVLGKQLDWSKCTFDMEPLPL